MTNKDFLRPICMHMATAIDRSIVPVRTTMKWEDITRNLADEVSDDEIKGSVTFYTNSRGAVVTIDYHSSEGKGDTSADYFTIKRRSDVGWTETIRLPIVKAYRLYKRFDGNFISWDNYAAQIRAAAI